MKLFMVPPVINSKFAMSLMHFFYDCSKSGEKGLLLINKESCCENIYCLDQIFEAYKASKIELTAIGLSSLEVATSVLFLMADERILIPKSSFYIFPESYEVFEKHFSRIKKTLPASLISEKCDNPFRSWEMTKKEIKTCEVVTKPPTRWMNLISEALPYEKNHSSYCTLDGDVSEKSAIKIVRYFASCMKNKQDATLIINSSGGDVDQLNLIWEAYHDSKIKHLTTIGTGVVASCASALFCMGDKRVLAPNTTFLLHQIRKLVNSRKDFLLLYELEDAYKSTKVNNNFVKSCYSKNTGISEEVFDSYCKNGEDWELTPDELMDYNVITELPEEWWNIVTKLFQEGEK